MHADFRIKLAKYISMVVLSLSIIALPNQAKALVSATGTSLLDNFQNIALWKAVASDGISAETNAAHGPLESALSLNYNFGKVAGYAAMRRSLPINLPDNYEISFYIRGDANPNTFQVKLLDSSGDNVWWYQKIDYAFPKDWQLIRIKKRQIDFAWGPIQDKALKQFSQIEFVVNKTHSGGRGSIQISDLQLRALPSENMPFPAPLVKAGISPNAKPLQMGNNGELDWHSKAGEDGEIQIDFGRPKEFGALVLQWKDHAFASHYMLDFSDDGARWTTARTVTNATSEHQALLLTESETRFIRLRFPGNAKEFRHLLSLQIKPLSYGKNANSFLQEQAKLARPGQYPRGFSGQQNYWTIIGNDGGKQTGLMSEDGALELRPGGISLEPFVVIGKQMISWADVKSKQSLQEDYLPLPSVQWQHAQFRLNVTSFATGTTGAANILTRYDLTNTTNTTLHLSLVLAARPMQVNPPSQFLNISGGHSPIHELSWNEQHLQVNSEDLIYPLDAPSKVVLSNFDSGITPEQIWHHQSHAADPLYDDTGMASALMIYDLTLAPHTHREIGIASRLEGNEQLNLPTQERLQWLNLRQQEVADNWRKKLNEVQIQVPLQGKKLHDTLRSALAHILMMRDGAALQPGTRSYARSWIRDGAMMSEALLRMGRTQAARDYLQWFAPYQFENGKTPCCVDQRGADPVPENDSHGEFIFLTEALYRYTHDQAALRAMWPHIQATMKYMEALRQSERSEKNRTQQNVANFGLMPASISHEGYSEKPMHSYWDDFWALRGYKDAVSIATSLGQTVAAAKWASDRDQFRDDIYASLDKVITSHHIDYLPGCAELADFDATSTTVALSPGGEQENLPAAALQGSFERYWSQFDARRRGLRQWDVYTPYEIRTIASFIRLGWRERAQDLLKFFFAGQRPFAWNQWAEVVSQDPRKIIFVGDMPHGWIASDYIRSALDSFAYERESDQSLVLAAGIPQAWLVNGEHIAIQALRTTYGSLSYDIQRQGNTTRLTVPNGMQVPHGGFVFQAPIDANQAIQDVRINGKPVTISPDGIHFSSLPAVIEITQKRATSSIHTNIN